MRPVHVSGGERQPRNALLGTEYVNVVLDEVRHWDEMGLGKIACDAQRSTHVLAMDQDMHQASDRLISRRSFTIGGGVPKGPEKGSRVVLTADLPICCDPSVVVETVAKQSTEDRSYTERTFRARGHVSEYIPDAPFRAQ